LNPKKDKGRKARKRCWQRGQAGERRRICGETGFQGKYEYRKTTTGESFREKLK